MALTTAYKNGLFKGMKAEKITTAKQARESYRKEYKRGYLAGLDFLNRKNGVYGETVKVAPSILNDLNNL